MEPDGQSTMFLRSPHVPSIGNLHTGVEFTVHTPETTAMGEVEGGPLQGAEEQPASGQTVLVAGGFDPFFQIFHPSMSV